MSISLTHKASSHIHSSPGIAKSLNGVNHGSRVSNIQPVNFNNPALQTIDLSKHGPITQLINNQYRSQKNKDVKRLILGRKLKALLAYEYADEEYARLPVSVKNLLRFNKSITTAEIVKFIEYVDKSHEITFKDFNFEHVKFRALFEALGDLSNLEMQVGPNNFVELSDSFDLKQKIFSIFAKFRETLPFVGARRTIRRRKKRKKREDDC